MQRELDNANPTILNVSQLPSRRKDKAGAVAGGFLSGGPYSRYDDILSGSWGGFDISSGSSDDGSDAAAEDCPGFTNEPIDEQEIYDLISTISDPEHPHTLGQLSVVNLPDIHLTPPAASSPSSLTRVLVDVTPTITHCSLATVIGLAVRVRLERALPPSFRVDVRIKEGSHSQDDQVNKQLADKERVAAALENDTLRGVLDKMLETCV